MVLLVAQPAYAGCTVTNASINFCDTTQTVVTPNVGSSSLTIDGVSTIGVYYSPANTSSPSIFSETLNVTGQTTISNAAGQFVVNGGAGISMVQTTSGTNGVILNSTITAGSGVTIDSRAQYGAGIFLESAAGGNLIVNSAANITVTGVDSNNVQVPNSTVLALASNASTYADGINAVTNLGSSSVTNSGTVTALSGRGLYSEGNIYAVTFDANENILTTSGPAVTVSADNTATGVINAYIPGIRVIDYYGLALATNEGYVHSTTRQAIVAYSAAGDSTVTNSGTAIADDRNAIVSETERGNSTITNSGTVTAGMLSVGSLGAAAGYSGLRATADYTGDISVTNTSTGIVTANYDAAIVAHTPQGNATVTNQGQVTGLNGVFIDSGAGVGPIDTLNDTSGPATNTITGTATLTNSGTITATAYGAYLDGTTNALTNSGTIATTGVTAIVTGNGDSTVTNSGTISAGSAAGTAISFGSGDNRLVLADTSSITGIVTNASTNNMLELTGTGSGSLALGQVSSTGAYQGFANLDKTGSGQWTLTGSGGSLTGNVAVGAGTLTLNGSLAVNAITVGSVASQGTLAISGGGILTTASDSSIGGLGGPNGSSITSANGINGVATISGTGSTWTENGVLSIGRGGIGEATVSAGGTLQTSALVLGSSSFDTVPGSGSLTVTGAGSSWTNGATGIGGVDIARIAGSTATLTISDGATVTMRGDGIETGSGATLSISGPTTNVQIGDPTNPNIGTWLTTGGTTTISGGASVYADGLYVNQGGSTGTSTMTVTGAGTTLNSAIRVYVGGLDGGPGSAPENGFLTISDGATVTTGSGGVGMDGTGVGTLVLTGAGSSLTTAANTNYGVAGNFYAAYAGVGTITVADGAALAVGNQLRIAWESGSTGTVNVGAPAGSAPVAPGAITAGLSIGFGDGDGTLVFNHTSTNYTLSTPITGAGAIDVLAGTTILSADDSGFSGTTTITGGTLQVNGALGSATNSLSVSGGGTLGGAGIVGGSVTVADGIVAPGNPTGTLTINGNLGLASNSILNFTLGQAGAVGGSLNSLIVVNGNLTLAGTVNVTQSPSGTYGPGLYRLISYSGTLTDNGLALGTMPAGSVNYLQTEVPGQINLVNTQGVVARYWDGDTGVRNDGLISGGNGTWTAARSGALSDDWTIADGSVNGAFDNANFAVFQGSSGVVTVSDAAGPVIVSGMQFVTSGYLVTGDAITLASGSNSIRVGDGTAAGASAVAQIDSVLTGSGSLVKNDLGTLVLTATNTYTGGTTVAAGTLTGTAASFGTGAIVDNAALVVTGAGTLANIISGSGTLEKTGAGTLTLSGSNSFTGGTTISGGTLVATTSSLAGSVLDNATLEFNQNFDGTFAGNISGSGGLVKDGTGVVTLTGLISYAGSTTVLGGQLVGNTSNIGGTVSNSGQVNFSQGFDGTYNSSISGTGSLLKSGTGTLVLTGSNSYTGGTTISSGTLQIGNGGTSGSLQGDVTDNGTLAVNRSDIVTFSGSITGSGSLTQAGTGTLVLTGTNSYSGGTTISSGTLQIGNGGTSGVLQGNVTDDGTLAVNRSDVVTLSGSITGSGSLTQAGAGTLILTGSNSYTGGTTIAAGTLQIGNGGTSGVLPGNVTDNGTLTVNRSDTATLSGSITGSGSLTQAGAGTLILTGTNSYTGGTTIASGMLQIGAGGTSGALQGDVTDSGALVVNRSDTVTLSGSITGSGSLTQAGAGTLVLTGTNSYSGGTTIASGTLQIGNGGTSGMLRGNVTDNGTLAVNRSDAVTFSGAIAGSGSLTQAGTGTLVLTGANSYTGGTTISSGTLQGMSASFGTGGIVDNGTLILSQSSNGDFASTISGSGSLTKTGAGSLSLDGVNSYTGTTTVSSGSLLVGSTAALSSASIASPVVVLSGGTLGGHGSVGATTVNSGGTLSPGNSIGTLTVNGKLTFSPGSTYTVEVDPASGTSDLTHASGTAALNGQVNATFLSETRPGAVYTILKADGGISGTFSSLSTTATSYVFLTPGLSYDANDVYLKFARNGTSMASLAVTPNERALATSLDGLPASSPLLNQVLGLTQGTNFPGLYDALSGEIHATAAGAILQDQQVFGQLLANHAVSRRDPAFADTPLWMQLDDGFTREKGDGNAAASRRTSGGATFGADTEVANGWMLGGAFRYDRDNVSDTERNSSAGIDSYSLGAYIANAVPVPVARLDGVVKIAGGLTYGWHQLSTRHVIGFSGFAQSDAADYSAHSLQVFGESGYEFAVGKAAVEPYVAVVWNRLRTNGFAETGGNASLTSGGTTNSSPATSMGVGSHLPIGAQSLTLDGDIAWQHLYGGVDPKANLSFSGGQDFLVTGTPMARDAAIVDIGMTLEAQPNLSVSASYTGRFGGDISANGGRIRVDYRF